MANKKALYHSELAKMGEVEVFVDSDPIESTYKRGTYFVAMKIDGQERTYTPALRECAEAFRGFKNRNVKLIATGSDYDGATDANIEILGGTTTRQTQQRPPPERQPDRQQERQPDRTQQPQARDTKPNNKMPINGQTVGMAVNNACQYLMSQGKELTGKHIWPIASGIIRISQWMENGDLAPLPTKSKAANPPAAATPPPQQQQRDPEPPPPTEEAPPHTGDDVPF